MCEGKVACVPEDEHTHMYVHMDSTTWICGIFLRHELGRERELGWDWEVLEVQACGVDMTQIHCAHFKLSKSQNKKKF